MEEIDEQKSSNSSDSGSGIHEKPRSKQRTISSPKAAAKGQPDAPVAATQSAANTCDQMPCGQINIFEGDNASVRTSLIVPVILIFIASLALMSYFAFVTENIPDISYSPCDNMCSIFAIMFQSKLSSTKDVETLRQNLVAESPDFEDLVNMPEVYSKFSFVKLNHHNGRFYHPLLFHTIARPGVDNDSISVWQSVLQTAHEEYPKAPWNTKVILSSVEKYIMDYITSDASDYVLKTFLAKLYTSALECVDEPTTCSLA